MRPSIDSTCADGELEPLTILSSSMLSPFKSACASFQCQDNTGAWQPLWLSHSLQVNFGPVRA